MLVSPTRDADDSSASRPLEPVNDPSADQRLDNRLEDGGFVDPALDARNSLRFCFSFADQLSNFCKGQVNKRTC